MPMVLFFTTTLLFSCIGIVSLIGIKRWELTTGHVLGSNARPHINRVSHGVLLWVTHIIPTLLRVYTKWLLGMILRLVHKLVALTVLYVERLLEKTLHLVRHKTDVKRSGAPASVFLREVSEHKRQLLHAKNKSVRANPTSVGKE